MQKVLSSSDIKEMKEEAHKKMEWAKKFPLDAAHRIIELEKELTHYKGIAEARFVSLNKGDEEDRYALQEKARRVDQLKMDKEDMYFLAQRAEWYKSDWEEFETILNKNK